MGRPESLAALLIALLAGYAGIRFATTLFSELRDLTFVRVTQTTVADFTLRVFEHLHSLGARFHANRSTGALSRDVERGTAAIGFLIGVALFTVVPTVVEIGAVLAIMEIIACGVAAVMLLAGAQVLDGTMTVGDLVLVNACVIQVCLPLNSLGFVIRESNDALVRRNARGPAARAHDGLSDAPREARDAARAARDDRPPPARRSTCMIGTCWHASCCGSSAVQGGTT